MAPCEKKAREKQASLVFLDESGLLMAPLVRRTWAPKGHTPILRQRTRRHEKVSAIAVLTVSPRRKRVGLYFSLRPKANVTWPWLALFLQELQRHLRRPLHVIWDRLQAHRSCDLQSFLRQRSSIDTTFLPPYAPELNPVEMLWSYLKINPLANLPPMDENALAHIAHREIRTIQARPQLLRAFIRATPLSSCLE